MQVTIQLLGQLGDAAGAARRTLTVDAARAAQDVVRGLGDEFGDRFKTLVFDASGDPHACILLFVNSQRVAWNESRMLEDGDEILLATPIAGG